MFIKQEGHDGLGRSHEKNNIFTSLKGLDGKFNQVWESWSILIKYELELSQEMTK